MAGLVVLSLAQRAHASDVCSEAKQQIHTIGSFMNCLNACLGPADKVDVSSAVQCLPDGCFVTVTMSPQSAQRACSLGGCQLPRLIFDCPGLENGGIRRPEHELRLRPSFLLCPVDSVDAHGAFGIDRIEIGQDNEKLKAGQKSFNMIMADVPIPPDGEWKKKQLREALSTDESDKGCKLCDAPNGITTVHGLKALLSRDLSPYKNDFNEHLASYVIGTNDPAAHQWEFGTYRGSDGKKLTRLDVVKDKLKPICDCIKNNRGAIKSDNEDKIHSHFPTNQKRMQLGQKQKHPNIDAEVNVMTKLCEELHNYVGQMHRSNNRAVVPPTVVGAIRTAPIDRGAKSNEQLLHH
jgi:hypothetical protein